ncbi:MAG: glycosyltransferase family 4 protein [Thermoplasmatota archaeon]
MSQPAIVHVTAFYRPHRGGVENYTANLAAAQAAAGHQVTVVTFNTEGVAEQELQPDGVEVRRVPVTLRYHKGLYGRALRRELRALAADAAVFHVHAPFPLGLETAASVGRKARVPVVATFHGEGRGSSSPLYRILRAGYAWYEKRQLARIDRAVFLTEGYRESLGLPGRLLAASEVIETGVDTARFRPPKDKEAQQPARATGEAFRLLFVGSLVAANRYKGLHILLAALARLPPDVHLHVIGRGPLVEENQALAAELGVADRVSFRTDVEDDELPAAVRSADLFVLPSISGPENGPLVVLEAMASGVPVLCTRIPGPVEMLRGGELGLLAEPDDAGALARVIEAARTDPERLADLGAKGRAHSVAHHDWSRVAADYLALYDNVRSMTSR